VQKSGKLESFLAKRRKKNAAKDHRYIPSKRRSATDE
jgi:ribosomal RNA-processing protein 36